MKKQDHNTKRQKLHEIKEMMWNTMEKEEDDDGLKQIRENFIKSRKILPPTTNERIEEIERLVKPKTKITKKDIEVLEE